MASKITRWVSISLFIGAALSATTAFAAHLGCPDPSGYPTSNGCSLPGVNPGGFPYFNQPVKVKYKARKNGDFNLKAKFDRKSGRSSTLVFDPDNIFFIDYTKFKLKAKVKDGVAHGELVIKGGNDEFGISKNSQLVTADLAGAWAISEDGQLLGFDTMNIVCNVDLPINCTEAESIYIALDDAITPDLKNLKTTGVAITTVPVPAAILLFGSGVICLFGLARRRKARMV